MSSTSTLTRDRRTFAIIGAAMSVHRILGCGYLESIYHEALTIEFELCRIPFEPEVACQVHYKGHPLRGHYHADFICYTDVVVEVKARSATGPGDQAQVLHYLATTGLKTGLLLNFGTQRLEYRRLVLGADPAP